MKEVIVCDYAREFWATYSDFLASNEDNLVKCRHTFSIGIVELKDGREVFIMPNIKYVQWCKGRTYLIDGKLYHSGYPVRKEKNL